MRYLIPALVAAAALLVLAVHALTEQAPVYTGCC